MRRAVITVVVVFAVLLTVSCSNTGGPAGLIGPSTIGPSGAAADSATWGTDRATQLRFAADLTVPAYPICPLTPPWAGEIKGTGRLTLVLRVTADGAGGTHISHTIHGHGTATDALGNRWVWSDADLNNEVVGLPTGNTSGNAFTRTQRENFLVIGPKGAKIKVQGTFHITQVNGTTVVEVEKGNHEENEVCESGFVLTPI